MHPPPLNRLVPDHIKGFEAYIPSKPDDELMRLYRCSRLFRLTNNENPLGPPRSAREEVLTVDCAACEPGADAAITPAAAYPADCNRIRRLMSIGSYSGVVCGSDMFLLLKGSEREEGSTRRAP